MIIFRDWRVIYKKKDFYFKVDPFTFENIDHYTQEDLNLSGEFCGGKYSKTDAAAPYSPGEQFAWISDEYP